MEDTSRPAWLQQARPPPSGPGPARTSWTAVWLGDPVTWQFPLCEPSPKQLLDMQEDSWLQRVTEASRSQQNPNPQKRVYIPQHVIPKYTKGLRKHRALEQGWGRKRPPSGAGGRARRGPPCDEGLVPTQI